MRAPEIRYVRTSDGVNIAYWTLGSGVPLVLLDLLYSNVQAEWQDDTLRAQYESYAAAGVMLVRFDHRGYGVSDRYERELTTEALVRDLEAVTDRLSLRPFFLVDLFGMVTPVALRYAALHPERVRRMVLFVGGARAGFVPSILEARGVDWHFVTESIARSSGGWGDNEAAMLLAARMRAATDEAGLRRYMRWWESRAREDVSAVGTPTLVVAVDPRHWPSRDSAVAAARSMAAGLPDASLALVEGARVDEFQRNYAAAAVRFLAQDPEFAAEMAARASQRQQAAGAATARQPAPSAAPAGTAVILFTDIADSTALTERLGDAAFRERSRALDAAVRAAIRDAGGTAVEGKVLGDGVMGVFASAAQAIAAARRCAEAAGAASMPLHIGLHAGDVQREDGNVYGGAVNIASRICVLCAPGEILVSQTVRDLARTSAGATFEDRGEQQLKGIGDPVRVFAVP